jgi:hypothetical protein
MIPSINIIPKMGGQIQNIEEKDQTKAREKSNIPYKYA